MPVLMLDKRKRPVIVKVGSDSVWASNFVVVTDPTEPLKSHLGNRLPKATAPLLNGPECRTGQLAL